MTDAPHPWIPGWEGQRSWAAPGEAPSTFISYTTEDDAQPFRIVHDRDMLFMEDRLEQDYNFIDYFFGDPENAYRARHYLRDEEISIGFPEGSAIPGDAAGALATLPPEILSYCQRRFAVVTAMTKEGYQAIWPGDS